MLAIRRPGGLCGGFRVREEDLAGDDEDRYERMERLIEKAMKRMTGIKRKVGAGAWGFPHSSRSMDAPVKSLATPSFERPSSGRGTQHAEHLGLRGPGHPMFSVCSLEV